MALQGKEQAGRSWRIFEQSMEASQRSLEQAGHGDRRAIEAGADFGQRQAVPVLEHDGLALIIRQLHERLGEVNGGIVRVGGRDTVCGRCW
jgi:hypothetical protein